MKEMSNKNLQSNIKNPRYKNLTNEYKQSRGASPSESKLLPEEAIRRMRDGETCTYTTAFGDIIIGKLDKIIELLMTAGNKRVDDPSIRKTDIVTAVEMNKDVVQYEAENLQGLLNVKEGRIQDFQTENKRLCDKLETLARFIQCNNIHHEALTDAVDVSIAYIADTILKLRTIEREAQNAVDSGVVGSPVIFQQHIEMFNSLVRIRDSVRTILNKK
ncbi:MAG: hypothetical protein ACRD9Q_11345 [Nitrososphaeraceae archaeon]